MDSGVNIWKIFIAVIAFVCWCVRLEAKVMNNKLLQKADVKTLNIKIDNNEKNANEKHTVIFDKLDKVETTTHETNLTVVRIEEQLKNINKG